MDKELNIKGLNMHSYKLFAVLLMLFSISTTSFAALTGKGTKSEPYIIDEAEDLVELRDIVSNVNNQSNYYYVKQTEDVDMLALSNASNSNKATRPPLPLSSCSWSQRTLRYFANARFLGEYDGGGHTISNWKITKDKMLNPVNTKNYNISLFGKIGDSNKEMSVIKDLNIEGFDLELQATSYGTNASGFAFLTSEAVNTQITNVHIKNSKAHGLGHYSFGALVANSDNKTIIENCSVRDCEFNPTAGSESVGAFCGVNGGSIKNCFAYNVVLNGNEYMGGLVGQQNGGIVENCGFNGKLGTSSSINIQNCGGLCGKVNRGEFINCFTVFDNDGKTWNSAKVFGGLIGVVAEDAQIVVKNCYSFPQVKVNNSNRDNVDFFVGRDMNKEGSLRFYESCYCYNEAYGTGFKPIIKDGVDFTDDYKNKHNLLVAERDYMRSGCFAEILRDYHQNNLLGPNEWREDVEFMNDTLPVLRFMVDANYDVDPFCHPGIYTLAHSESGNMSKLKGQLKYITNDQTTEGWIYGFEVKVGNGKWERVSDWTATLNENKINFFYDYEYSKSKTIVYRAYTYKSSNPTKIAYGMIDTVNVGTSSGPETIEGCDTLLYDNHIFTPKDNGSYINSSNEEVIINVGVSRRNIMPLLEGGCDAKSVSDGGVVYDKSGIYETKFKNETGCMTTNVQEVKLYPTLPAKDSLKVFSVNEMSYTYTPRGGIAPQTVKVGSEYVLQPKLLVVDQIKYAKKSTCDSATIVVNYVIPVKITSVEDTKWSCTPVVYNGVTYTKETVVTDTIKTPDSKVPGGMLYEIKSRHIKVAVPDTILNTKKHCGVIEYECPTGICESDEPFYDTVVSPKTISGSQCPASVTITHHIIGERPTREETIVSCGPYTMKYKNKTYKWEKSGDYQVIETGDNFGSCDNETIVTYHVTIGESVSYNDTTIHGCGRIVFKNLSGENIIFDKSQDYVDEVKSVGDCSSKRIVHVYIHNKTDKSSILPVTGCAPYTFVKMNGDELVFDAGVHTVKDTLRTKDGCNCDSIVKTTILNIEKPATLKEKVVNGCDEVEVEGIVCKYDTSFVVEKKDPNKLKACRTQFQPYKVVINSSIVEHIHVDTCGVFEKNGRVLKTSGKIEINKPSQTGCDNKEIYDVRIIEPVRIDSVVYACDSYVHKFYDGRQEMIDKNDTLIDILKSKVCSCDSIIRKVEVNISHDSYQKLNPVTNCGPYTFTKSNGKKVLIEKSQVVKDTTTTIYGCHVYSETEVNIIPVETTVLKLDTCKAYNSVVPVWNYNNLPVSFIVETPDIRTAELIFLKKNESHPACMDTTKLFLTVHGVGKVEADPVVECDSFIYKDFDGTNKLITSDSIIVDTLKSTVCDCDSIILTTKVKINNSVPESLRQTNKLRSCDSVIYLNSKGIEMKFFENIQFLDTFKMKNTGCDSVVIVDVTVPKSTGSITVLSACGDTTLIDSVNNFPHFFDKTSVWRQILSENEEGCSNFKEWHVNITPTPHDTIFETGCGELTFRGDTYTSENDRAKSFSLDVIGSTKCDTIHSYYLTVYPKYNLVETLEGCGSVERNGVVYTKSIYFRDSFMSRNNCDSIVNVDIVINEAHDTIDYISKCNEVKFVDKDFNGGLPVYVHHDSIIYVDKVTDKGCAYQYIQHIEVGHPTYVESKTSECYDVNLGYASYRDLHLISDTIIYDTIASDNKCGTVIANIVNLTMPVFDTVNIYQCLDTTIGYVTYRDFQLTADTIITDTTTSEDNCFVIVANKVNIFMPNEDSVSVFNQELFACDSIKFIDADFNGGESVVFNNDTTVILDKIAGDGCAYQLIKEIHIGTHSDSSVYLQECFDSKLGYASFRNLNLTSDTIIYDTIASRNRCGTIVKNTIHLVAPDFETNNLYMCYDSKVGYVSYRGLRLKSDTTLYDTISSDNICGKVIENKVHLIMPDLTTAYVDTMFGCDSVKYIDADYNGGLPVYFSKDTTFTFRKSTTSSCEFQLTQIIEIGTHSDSVYNWSVPYDSKDGYSSFRDFHLTSDTIIYDTIVSSNRCGTVVKNFVNLMMPVHDTISFDSCLHVTYEGIVYRDSAHIVRHFKTELGVDSFLHVMINVNKCFPYPVLVNKYNWILVCNDVIFDETKFKNKSNVKYRWYKNDALVSSTSEAYFTEDKELNGCYQVGLVVEDGSEYLSDLVCIDDNHKYSITPQPNPVEKLSEVYIVCDFPDEGVEGTDVEVFNMTADKVYVTKATSNTIVIPGVVNMTGYYLVRLTTVSGKVLTAKYIVK